jgi:hypothetical protein
MRTLPSEFSLQIPNTLSVHATVSRSRNQGLDSVFAAAMMTKDQVEKIIRMVCTVRSAIVSVTFGMAFLITFIPPVVARGLHGFGRGLVSHGSQFAGGHRHGNDSYIKAASDDRDKLLNTKLKSICRGC